ncbi:Transcription factor TFIIIC complex subunit Tfc6, putative [Penicillium digitatum PHI26]|uniref:Transcription factor TFIIIC complex subunit Tfc6, putative n=2 Tax=Penicillium digitatum TaxID=36651 RepID=K9FT21_PEND2|nr:Transcription factor TFIIIC complex subunit Tfc6, putative [Penicillium digitatum Pd1]EKV05868.1 Transcription factor TFIIIC complex subunit Tfc6, putative [Penicillium digitatum PHI26]EKV17926.1 Transcription factor TFIIIC complex subunit Tfc6, putative [Penicillium digitatum Pd1]KAG0155098.1 hypothetical protein PDIDSM_671 [Penicillium digitatum]
MTSGRRSGRFKGPRAVYIDDPFKAAGISDDEDSTKQESLRSGKKKRTPTEDSASDHEFVAGSGEEADEGIDEEDEPEEELEEEFGSEADASDPEDLEIDGIESALGKGRSTSSQHDVSFKKRRADGTVVPSAEETHIRGIIEPRDHLSKSTYYTLTFGSDDRDLMPAIHFRMRWNKGIDAVFPSRFTLEETEKKPEYLYGPTFGVHPDDVMKESTRGWDWYYDRDTGERFRKRQRIETIGESVAFQNYLPQPDTQKCGILLGPHDNQQLFELGYHESFDFGKAWEEPSSKVDESKTGTKRIREGWMLNIGQKAHCMTWAPNQNGLTQYLAVAAAIKEDQKNQYKSEESEPVSSFQPSEPFPSALQIWEFKGKPSDTPTMTLDMDSKPRLRQVWCADWGDLRRMVWCNLPRTERAEDEEDEKQSIGLLATVWGDGYVRVLDIKTGGVSQETEFFKIKSPAFEAKPPSTVCTCVTWLSPSDLVVGCGNGFVAIWNIEPSSTSQPLPYFYRPLHATYILNITSAYPVHPQLIITISMDGETRMWSVLDPTSEMTSTGRMRGASPYLSYSPICQSVIAGDENEFARIIPIRRFFTTTTIARLSSTISAMAQCSYHHPCALFGSAAGEVVGTNPFRRVVYNKEQIWQQIWFTHEWIPTSKTDTVGTSRFHDGYRAENQKLATNKLFETNPVNGMGTSTIFEENTHVTALGWNPNRPCAAWASAALGCGLVRVEDLAI